MMTKKVPTGMLTLGIPGRQRIAYSSRIAHMLTTEVPTLETPTLEECTLSKSSSVDTLTRLVTMNEQTAVVTGGNTCRRVNEVTKGIRNVLGMAWASGILTYGYYYYMPAVIGCGWSVTMGLSTDPDREVWAALVRYEVATVNILTPRRRPRARGRAWKATHLCAMLLAAVACLSLTMYWVFRLVERMLASYADMIQHPL